MLRVGASSCKMQIRYARLIRFCDDDTMRFFDAICFFKECYTSMYTYTHIYAIQLARIESKCTYSVSTVRSEKCCMPRLYRTYLWSNLYILVLVLALLILEFSSATLSY